VAYDDVGQLLQRNIVTMVTLKAPSVNSGAHHLIKAGQS
jgi:hypothetical protein